MDHKQLATMVEDAVGSALKGALPEILRRANTKPYLTKSELMELTGWSSRTVEYRKKSGLPFVRQGRLVLFPTDAVYDWLEEGRVG